MTNQAPVKNNQPARSTAAIQSRPGRPVSGINTPTPLEPIATAPTTKQTTVPSAHAAPTVESLSVLIIPTLAPRSTLEIKRSYLRPPVGVAVATPTEVATTGAARVIGRPL